MTFDRVFNFETKRQGKNAEEFTNEVNNKVLDNINLIILNYLVPLPESEDILEVIEIKIKGTKLKRIFIRRIYPIDI